MKGEDVMAVKTVDTKATVVADVPSPSVLGQRLTALNSATIVGNDMYILKTRSSNFELCPICICKISNFTTPASMKTTTIKIVDANGEPVGNIARHANAITFAKNATNSSGYFFVATMNEASEPQVLMISMSGVLKKRIRYEKNDKLSRLFCMDYVGMSGDYRQFICGVGCVNNRYKYDFAVLKGNVLEYTGVSFSGTDEIKGWSNNDITYHNNKLFSTHFKVDSNGVITYNRIYHYDLSKPIKGQSTILTPVKCMTSNRPAVYDKAFEIEAFCMRSGVWYGAYNCQSSNSSYNKDRVFKLTRLS